VVGLPAAWEPSDPGRPGPFRASARRPAGGGGSVLILGVILLVIGLLANIGILTTIGLILIVIGAVLWILGSMGRPLAGRRHYW
jgi:hypothetical protein